MIWLKKLLNNSIPSNQELHFPERRLFFPLPIYLNYKYVIDLSAVMEDGFSEFEELKSKYTNNETTSNKAGGGLGIAAKAFSIVNLGANLKGEYAKGDSKGDSHESAKRKVQTNTSMLAKLRNGLYDQGMVASQYGRAEVEKFIEIRGSFSKPPLSAALEAMTASMDIGVQLEGLGNNGRKSRKAQVPPQITALMKLLDDSGSVDLIFSMVDDSKAIVSFDKEVLEGKNIDDILAGEYTLFGKISSIIKKEESWSLLQKTPLGIFHDSVTENITKVFQEDENLIQLRKTVKLPEMVTTSLQGPILLVEPIAVYS